MLLGGVLHATVNCGRAQPAGAADCASAHRQRAMRLMPLRPLGPSVSARVDMDLPLPDLWNFPKSVMARWVGVR